MDHVWSHSPWRWSPPSKTDGRAGWSCWLHCEGKKQGIGRLRMKLTGGCFCGAVEIEVSGAPEAMGYCHCRSCRSWSGGPVNAFSLWPLSLFLFCCCCCFAVCCFWWLLFFFFFF